MAEGKPDIRTRETAYAGYLTVERVLIRLADGAEVWREIERHGDAVAVLPYDAARRCAVVARLFRAPVFDATGETSLLEACAGMIEGEPAEDAARREACEELGIALTSLDYVARIWSSPGVSTERQTLFLAPYRNTDRTGPGGGVAGEHEGITVIELPLPQLARDAAHGRIADGKLLTLIFALQLRRPDLFAEPNAPNASDHQ
jgi:nudix-type nucleoside diphosphatase (YffH/AdpP family)